MRLSNIGRKFFSTLVIADYQGSKFNKGTLKVLNAATQLKQPISLLIASDAPDTVLKQVQDAVKNDNVARIIVAQNPALKSAQADALSQLVKQLIEQYKFKTIVGGTSSQAKDFIPRVAAQYKSQPVTDVIEVINEKSYKRPVYAGNAIATVESQNEINFLTFRPTNFEELPANGKSPAVEKFDFKPENLQIKHVEDSLQESDKPELTAARIVVAGGRGLQSKENFKILDDLADALGNAAVGASRAAVDAGYVPNDLQIGQTGKVVAPELYFAIGISGAIQHLAGMKDSKVIVAINKDEEASIMQVADYALVGDLFKVVPELTEKLKQLKQ